MERLQVMVLAAGVGDTWAETCIISAVVVEAVLGPQWRTITDYNPRSFILARKAPV